LSGSTPGGVVWSCEAAGEVLGAPAGDALCAALRATTTGDRPKDKSRKRVE
jgi:hypothetical protein